MSAQEQYLTIGKAIAGAEDSQMFGKPCFKTGGKAFICFFQDCMVFKLAGTAHQQALALEGSVLFDPSGNGRAMKAWVQVPFAHQALWATLAHEACTYAATAA